jgi:uncharacterized membrane protein YkoI
VFVAVLAVFPALATETRIKRTDLPPAVEKTVDAQSQGAKIQGFSEEKENGQTLYELEMVVDGHSKDILISSDGAVVEVEEQVRLDSLAQPLRAGLQAKAGKGKVVKVESVTKRGSIVAYEAQVVTDRGRKYEVQVGPDGKSLDHEE